MEQSGVWVMTTGVRNCDISFCTDGAKSEFIGISRPPLGVKVTIFLLANGDYCCNHCKSLSVNL